jgi:catechol 2,3-dioxygenase-like lactoylglutathione lyase family enzyme
MLINRITRRDALFMLSAVAVTRARAEGMLRVTRVDHVALDVGDMDKAMSFYRRLFGNEVLKDSKTPRRYLRLGPCYLAIAPAAAGQAPHINHFSVGIENFNAAAMKSTLEGAGMKVRESNVGLFVTDPDGNSVQIWADQSWKLLSNASLEKYPKQEALFHAIGMHHMAVQSSDLAKSVDFYGKLFGRPIYDPPGNPQPVFQAGETRIRIYDPKPDKPAKIDHFSALVENFDAPAALRVVKSLGAKAELSKQGTLNEFYDPEGIRMQVTVPGQTYGTPAKK